MKIFVIGTIVTLGLVGAAMLASMTAQTTDYMAVEKYMESRGKAQVPSSWRSKMGKGI